MGDTVTDYYHIEPDPNKDPPEYTTYERRAEVLDFAISAGSPKALNQNELSTRYDVSPSIISRDISRLGEALSEAFDTETVLFETRALREKVVTDLLNEDDWRATAKAWSIHTEFIEWLGVEGPGPVNATADETDTSPRRPDVDLPE